MFLKSRMKPSTDESSDQIDRLREAIEQAEGIVIGAGAGMSVSAGLTYTGERFQKYFHDFEEKYHFHDMYTGGFWKFECPEEYWAYWNRYIYINRYLDAPKPVYEKLFELIKNRDYFVLTTNVDHCFQKAGFDKKRLFYTQGDYGLWQCSGPCHRKTYDNESVVRRMVEQQKNMKIPSELIPYCPVCGRPMCMNLRVDDRFVEDDGWHLAAARYEQFLEAHEDRKTLFLELGTGMNTPGIIKFSFWKMVFDWPNAIYACLNLNEACTPDEIRDKSICISDDIGNILSRI